LESHFEDEDEEGLLWKHEDQVALRKLGFRDRLVSAGGKFDMRIIKATPEHV
jgi:hypothetical protein